MGTPSPHAAPCLRGMALYGPQLRSITLVERRHAARAKAVLPEKEAAQGLPRGGRRGGVHGGSRGQHQRCSRRGGRQEGRGEACSCCQWQAGRKVTRHSCASLIRLIIRLLWHVLAPSDAVCVAVSWSASRLEDGTCTAAGLSSPALPLTSSRRPPAGYSPWPPNWHPQTGRGVPCLRARQRRRAGRHSSPGASACPPA